MVAVYTARYSYRGPDRFDITRRGADKGDLRAGVFAPPRWLLNIGKGYSTSVPAGVEPLPSDPLGRWRWYDREYTRAMRRSYREHRAEWEALLALPEATLVCFCPHPAGCHRGLLAALLAQCGAVHCGERQGGGRG